MDSVLPLPASRLTFSEFAFAYLGTTTANLQGRDTKYKRIHMRVQMCDVRIQALCFQTAALHVLCIHLALKTPHREFCIAGSRQTSGTDNGL